MYWSLIQSFFSFLQLRLSLYPFYVFTCCLFTQYPFSLSWLNDHSNDFKEQIALTHYQYHVHSNLQQANASIMLKQHVIHLIHLQMIIHSKHSPFIIISLFLKLSRSETKWRLDRSIWNHHPYHTLKIRYRCIIEWISISL